MTKSLPFSTHMCNYYALSQGTLQYDVKTSRKNEREMRARKMETRGDVCMDFTPVHSGPSEEHGDLTHIWKKHI